MKCFQVLSSLAIAASAVSSVYGGVLGGQTASYGYAAPAAYSGAAVGYAAPYSQAVVHAAPAAVQSHEIHTGGAANTVRVEEYKAGGQVVRVHDAPQRPTEFVNVQGPAQPASHIRVVAKTGPTQVQRAVFQDPSVQVFDVVNPPKPADRVINIQRAAAPPAHVELVAEQHHAVPEVTVGGDAPNVQVVRASPAYQAAPAVAHVKTVHAAPAFAAVHAAPAFAAVHAAPAFHAVHAAPAFGYAATTYGHKYASTGNSVVLH